MSKVRTFQVHLVPHPIPSLDLCTATLPLALNIANYDDSKMINNLTAWLLTSLTDKLVSTKLKKKP